MLVVRHISSSSFASSCACFSAALRAWWPARSLRCASMASLSVMCVLIRLFLPEGRAMVDAVLFSSSSGEHNVLESVVSLFAARGQDLFDSANSPSAVGVLWVSNDVPLSFVITDTPSRLSTLISRSADTLLVSVLNKLLTSPPRSCGLFLHVCPGLEHLCLRSRCWTR